jgi:hypothetical protein
MLLWCAVFACLAPAADLPVKRVVLYKNGVGYFERAGEVKAGETARLEFQASEMNDVLKSLTINEAGGGVVRGLRYDSSQPLDVHLKDFPFKLAPEQPLTGLLDQLRGARVELKLAAETAVGAIVGARLAAATEQRPEQALVTLLTDAGDLRTFDLAAVSALRLADPQLQAQLKEYLEAVSEARSREKRSVYIDSTAPGARRLVAGYMVPTPIWKSSYRLIFREGGEPLLEGWAIVDNTSGEDWRDVELALVSGRPTSFISQLYEPRYRQRPTAELPEDTAQGPVIHEGAVGAVALMSEATAAPPSAAPARMNAMRKSMRLDAASSVAVSTATREVGELFEYRFSMPVTVRKGESAMLPFVQQKLAARKLLIYAESYGAHPMSAAELSNVTGKTLDGGPLTIFDGHAYAGEALMETLKTGDKRLISYATDLGTRVTTNFDSTSDMVREIKCRRGTLITRSSLQETKTYTIHNVDRHAKTLVIEHPVRSGYRLLSPKPAETTASYYRFEVTLPPAGSAKLPVAEERLFELSYAVANLTPDDLLVYVRNKSLGAAARAQLEQILQKKNQIADNDGAIARAEGAVAELGRDQQRIRQNIDSLNRVSGQQEQVQKYAQQLSRQETQLVSLRDGLNEFRQKKAALAAELSTLILKVEF